MQYKQKNIQPNRKIDKYTIRIYAKRVRNKKKHTKDGHKVFNIAKFQAFHIGKRNDL